MKSVDLNLGVYSLITGNPVIGGLIYYYLSWSIFLKYISEIMIIKYEKRLWSDISPLF